MRFLKRIWSSLVVWWRPSRPLTAPWLDTRFKFRVDWYLHVDGDLEKVEPHVLPDKENR